MPAPMSPKAPVRRTAASPAAMVASTPTKSSTASRAATAGQGLQVSQRALAHPVHALVCAERARVVQPRRVQVHRDHARRGEQAHELHGEAAEAAGADDHRAGAAVSRGSTRCTACQEVAPASASGPAVTRIEVLQRDQRPRVAHQHVLRQAAVATVAAAGAAALAVVVQSARQNAQVPSECGAPPAPPAARGRIRRRARRSLDPAATSCPSVNGSCQLRETAASDAPGSMSPTSEWHRPLPATLISTSPVAGRGTRTSCSCAVARTRPAATPSSCPVLAMAPVCLLGAGATALPRMGSAGLGTARRRVCEIPPMTRWQHRPAGSNWGEFGADDQRGRMNLLTPERRLAGVREVREGRVFCAEPAAGLPGRGLGCGTRARRPSWPRRASPTARRPIPFTCPVTRRRATDVVCDDAVTLCLQYSTQWDALAHCGSEFDADGDGVREAVFYNGFRAGEHIPGPMMPGGTGARALGIENLARAGVQGRGVLIDLLP